MSLHALANNMAAQGRGPDSTLVHMSPREVHGLQALAMANGGTLTINPHTGLPEAGFLDSLLPALVGFGLNAFVPGLGAAVGGMFGLGGAAGTALAVGGATALASGDLNKGLMAGLGAYGGAGLESSLAGVPSGMDAASAARDAGISAAAEASPAATAARLQAGANTAMSAPTDFLKSNYMNLGLAAAPALSGAFGEQPTSNAPKQQIGNRYMYKVDPLTGQSYAYKTYTGDEIKDSPPVRFGNANGGLMQHYDDGGVVSRDFSKDPVKFGNVTDPVDINGNPFAADQKDMRSDSERAQDYLSGKGPNPFLFYHKAPTVDPIQKAAEATKEIAKVVEEQQQHGGNPADRAAAVGSSVSNYAPDVNSYSNGLVHALLNPVANNAPVVDAGVASGFKSVAEAEAGQRAKVLNAINNTNFSGMDKGSVSNAPSTPDTKEVQDRINNTNFSGMDRSSTSTDKVHDSENSATGERDHDPGSKEARGGLNLHGRYYPPSYADGGITGGGNIDLHVPINIGGGQGGMGGGLSSLGSLGGGNGIQQGGMSRPSSNFLQQQQQGLPGYQAVQKAQQDYNNSDEYKNFQQYAQQYQQSLGGGQSGIFGGMMGGARGGLGPQNNMLMPLGGQNGLYGGPRLPELSLIENTNHPEDAFNAKNNFADGGGITALAHGGVMRPFFSQRTGKYQEHTPLMYAEGGMYNLGSYSDGGRLLRGPGDGVSDSIPATIGEKQPARLADGEFVVPARIVSELGNGSTEAGARKLYDMMDRVQKARSKTVGKDRVATNTRADNYLPA